MSKRDVSIFLLATVCGGMVVSIALLKSETSTRNVVAKRGSLQIQLVSTPIRYENVDYALEGYCPVTLIEQRKWKRGDVQYRERRGDQVFLFAGSEEKDRFLENPKRYMPVFNGNDIVSAKKEGKITRGKRQHGLTYGERIFLFSSEEALETFFGNPKEYLVD